MVYRVAMIGRNLPLLLDFLLLQLGQKELHWHEDAREEPN